MARRRYRIPLVRIGLALIVGAMAVSLVDFYVGFGAFAADMEAREAMPESRAEVLQFFIDKFLLFSSAAAILFWLGLGLVILGIFRFVLRRSLG